MKKTFLLLMVVGLVFFTYDCKKAVPLPVADFSYYVYVTVAGQVDFTNLSTDADSFSWDFGDGTMSYHANPTHLYNANGNYTVTLVATGDGGESSVQVVIPINNFPLANFTFIENNSYPGEIDFTNYSTNAVTYSWNFGDGSSSSQTNPAHTYAANGTYTVTLQATGNGVSDSYSHDVDVTNIVGPTEICVWTSLTAFPCSTSVIDVFIDDQNVGSLDSFFSSAPDCGATGTVTIDVTPGSHKFYAQCQSGTTNWGPVYNTVDEGTCFQWEISSKGIISLKNHHGGGNAKAMKARNS